MIRRHLAVWATALTGRRPREYSAAAASVAAIAVVAGLAAGLAVARPSADRGLPRSHIRDQRRPTTLAHQPSTCPKEDLLTTFTFERATKKAAHGRLALDGPSGSGKTFTALTFARVLGERIAVIDTEHRSASKYADLFDFDTLPLDQYDPRVLIQALAAAAQTGHDVAIVDSLSHFWMGTDGMLEQVDRAAKRAGGHGMSGWKEMRPVERQMVEALLAYPGHVICTLRTKTDWVEGTNPRTGKPQMVKQGTKAEQREGLEYEFDVVGSLDLENELTVVKSRCPALSGAMVKQPGPEFAEKFKAWLDDGVKSPTAAEIRDQVCADPWATYDQLLEVYRKAERHGLLAAPVTTDTGDTAALGEFIKARGVEAKNRTARQAAERASEPAEPASAPQPAAEPHPVTGGDKLEDRRRKRMHALWNDLGYSGDANRPQRLNICARIVEREIATTSDLTFPKEVEQVIAALEDRQRAQQAEAGDGRVTPEVARQKRAELDGVPA